MELKKHCRKKQPFLIFLLFLLVMALEAAPIKLKVIVDNASIQATREIGGKILTRCPLNTILDAERKQGEWYRVKWEEKGISGYIHEMLVEEVSEEELARETGGQLRGGKSQAEIAAEIQLQMEENKRLVRQKQNVERAINSLGPLLAKAIALTDQKRQKELTTEIFLWIGLGYEALGDELSALKEFKNMFEVNHAYAKEITRNILDSKIMALIQQAENEYLGLVTEYTLEIVTEPKEAKVKINGKEIGLSPEIYRTPTPKLVIEIEKEGYKPIREEIFITQSPFKKEYVLEMAGKDVEIKSDPGGAKVYLDGVDTGQATNCVLPAVPFGRHLLSLKKENYGEWQREIEVRIGKEPLVVEAALTVIKYQFIYKWGSPQSKFFSEPLGITVDKENNIYIVDSAAIKAKKMSPEGQVIISWGSQGTEFRSLKKPSAIAVDNQGNAFITDVKLNCVMKFDKNGKFIKKWGSMGSGKINFNNPSGIAVDSKGDIYVADSANNRIVKYSGAGIFLKTWGIQGTSDGNFVYPVAVAISPGDKVFVVDRARVQKFSPEGEFFSSWGKVGTGEGEFNRPGGIFIDQIGYIYIADSGNNRMLKFDEKGKFMAQWGSAGAGDGQMMYPAGVAVDSRGYVYVIDRDNSRLQLFGPPGSSEP